MDSGPSGFVCNYKSKINKETKKSELELESIDSHLKPLFQERTMLYKPQKCMYENLLANWQDNKVKRKRKKMREKYK